jgi:outer membrane receptor protein involved in Fe transport
MRTRAVALGLLLGAVGWSAPGVSFAQEAGEKKEPAATESKKEESPAAEPKQEESERADAQEQEEPLELGKVTVTAEGEKPYYVQSIITEEEVEEARNSGSVDSLLKGEAGVQLSRKSFEGSDSSKILLRGFDESRSLILLNGRNLHGAGVYGGYYVDWSSLSLEEVKRVEITRGAGPAKYGNTLGGVVNIITRDGTEEPGTVLRGTGGSFGTWDVEGSNAGGIGPLRYSVAASHYGTDAYLRNAFVDRNAFAARLAFKLPAEIELKAGTRYTEGENGMIVYNRPDSPYYDDTEPKSLESQLGGPYVQFLDHGRGLWGPRDWGDRSYWRNERWQVDAGLFRDNEDFGFSLQTYLFDEYRKEQFYGVDDPHHLVLQRDSKPEDWNWGYRADFHNLLAGAGPHQVEYGLEGQYLGYGDMDVVTVDPNYFPPWGLPTSSPGERDISRLNGGYLQDLWKINDWLEVEAGFRFDSFEADGPEANAITIDEDKWSPRVGVTVRPWEGGHVTGRYARAYRFPTLPEYYWWYSGFQPEDRKNLTSEKANQWELEVGQRVSEKAEFTARWYYYEVDDYIRTVYGYMPSRVVYNIDRVDLQGVELEAFHQLPYGFSAWANYTVQKTEKRGDVLDKSSDLSDELVELPEHQFNLGLDYRRENGLEARLRLGYVGERHEVYGDQAVPGASTLKKMDSYADMDFNLSYPFFKGEKVRESRLLLAVQNILDERYEEEYGFPMPGITFTAGLSVKF